MAPPQTDDSEKARLRPFRVTVYALYFVFTLGFIGLVIRSVAREVYAIPEVPVTATNRPTAAACVKELDGLFGELTVRANVALTPGRRPTWDDFQRHFEHRLEELSTRCTDSSIAASDDVRSAIKTAASQLDRLRLHMARCGEEGETEREEMARALAALRVAVGVSP